MKQKKAFFMTIAVLLLLLTFAGHGQESEPKDHTDRQIKEAALEIMASASNCALITVDPEGRPRVREMDPFPPEEDFTVWFGTNPRSRKVEQIKNDPKVALYYLEENGAGYVMVYGKAQLVDDQKEKDRWWKEEWEAFYPNNKDDYLLIKVTPSWLEVVSYTHGIVGDPVTWEPPVLRFGSE